MAKYIQTRAGEGKQKVGSFVSVSCLLDSGGDFPSFFSFFFPFLFPPLFFQQVSTIHREMTAPGMTQCPAPLTPDSRVAGIFADRLEVDCPNGSTCVYLANFTTLLCCPPGNGNCPRIETIPCDLAPQDARDRQLAVKLKTVAMQHVLPRCGNNCCPFGYTCTQLNGISVCEQDADQTIPPELAA